MFKFNIFKIPQYFRIINTFNKEESRIQEEYMKSGWKTSEFWLTLLSSAASIVGALTGIIPAPLAAKCLVVLNGSYATLRTLAKSPEITTVVDNSTTTK